MTTNIDTAADTAAQEAAAPANSATDANETPTAGTETPGEAEKGVQPEEDSDEPRGRAGRLRERAQAAEGRVAEIEAQSAELAGTVERLQRLHVEQTVTAAGIKPAAVFAVAQLADLLDEAGLPDADKVKAAIGTAQEQLGVSRPTVQRQLGMRSGAGFSPPKKDGWASAFARRDE